MDQKAKEKRQSKRKRQILASTLRLLRRHGTMISTAQIAAEAQCSKETLYEWFGDRNGIFLALAEEQANAMGASFDRAIKAADHLNSREKLVECAAALLDILTGEALVALNRAAMASACRDGADLGLVVLDDWQARILAPLTMLLEEYSYSQENSGLEFEQSVEVFLGLLIGDRQRRLLLGEEVRPDLASMKARAEWAVEQWIRIYV